MNILITSLRAPVSMEWARLLQPDKTRIFGCDSFCFPVGRFMPNIHYFRLPEIKKHFDEYGRIIKKWINKVDLVIPTCEDIFWLAQLDLTDRERQKCFMPPREILLQLHHKNDFFAILPKCDKIAFPKTGLIQKHDDIVFDQGRPSLLKPVFSRFGHDVIRNVSPENCKALKITENRQWVMQEYIHGKSLCNFFISQNGRLIAHAAYRPKWLINNAAASFFEPVVDERMENFARKFCQHLNFTGQAAFDFVDDGEKLWVVECNPRATSGIHLFSGSLHVNPQGELEFSGSLKTRPLRIGCSLPLLFSWPAIKNKQFKMLWRDFRCSEDVLASLPFYAAGLSFVELSFKAWRQKQSLSAASTADMEYNGENLWKI